MIYMNIQYFGGRGSAGGTNMGNSSRFTEGNDYPANSSYYRNLAANFDREVADRASRVERSNGTSTTLQNATDSELDRAIRDFRDSVGTNMYNIDNVFTEEVLRRYEEERRRRRGR